MGEMTLTPQPQSLVGRPLPARAIARLEAAGRLLRGETDSRGRPTMNITPAPGEMDVHAIYRVIQTLSEARRLNLQANVNWLEDYGFEDSSPRPANRAAPAFAPATPPNHRICGELQDLTQEAPLTIASPTPAAPLDDDAINYEMASICESERANSSF